MGCFNSKETGSAATIERIRRSPYPPLFKRGIDAALAGSYTLSDLYFHQLLQASPMCELFSHLMGNTADLFNALDTGIPNAPVSPALRGGLEEGTTTGTKSTGKPLTPPGTVRDSPAASCKRLGGNSEDISAHGADETEILLGSVASATTRQTVVNVRCNATQSTAGAAAVM